MKEKEIEKLGRVAVLMGGLSREREVSMMTGSRVLNALQEQGVDAFELIVNDDVIFQLQQAKPDRVFNALHGPGGENGEIQGILEWLKIPYTGSGVMASALAMDKERAKLIFLAAGLPTLPFEILTGPLDSKPDFKGIIEKFGLPLAVKPTCEGSSFGMTKVTTLDEFEPAFQKARACGVVIVEPYIEQGEYTVGIVDDYALPVIKIETPSAVFYDYDAKYFSDETRYLIPSGLPATAEKELQTIALKAFEVLGCRDWGRIDALRDQHGKFWIMEANTVPGMTEHSLVPQAARAMGIEFPELVLNILMKTLNR